MNSEDDCLISRRNRHVSTARKRSLSDCQSQSETAISNCTRGIEEQSHRQEKCHKMMGKEESELELNNSDFWLAEMAMPSEHAEQPFHDSASLAHQQDLEHTPIKQACISSCSVTEDQSSCGAKSVQKTKIVNSVQVNGAHYDHVKTKTESDLLFKLHERKMSSPVVEKCIAFQDYASALRNKEPAAHLNDGMDFSGDADLFEDSMSELVSKDRLPHTESSAYQRTEGLENITVHHGSDHQEMFKGNLHNSLHQETNLEKLGNSCLKSATDKTPGSDVCAVLGHCDISHSQNHDDQMEVKSKNVDIFLDCDVHQVGTELHLETPKVQECSGPVLNTSETPNTHAGTEPALQVSKTSTSKAPGSCLKDRLKNRLLQNASTVTPAANNLEELRKESIAKAMLEASQIRREGFVSGIGPFYGLPSKVQELLSANRKITKLYDWQDECLKLPALYEGRNLIYTLPTSGGKTLVAEILILQQLLCKKRNALLVLPYISIVQEKVRILSEFATELGFLVEEYAGSKGRFPPTKRRQKQSLYVATIEKGQSLVNSLLEAGQLGELGLVVVDELHMIGEGGSRGSAMESCLLKLLNATKEPPQVIGMSATLNNIADLAKFLEADIFSSDFRPVNLTEFVKVEDNLYQVNNKALVPEDRLQHDKILTFPHSEESQQMDPDHLLHLVLEIVPQNSCLLFCPTKRYCENVALMLAKMMRSHHRHLSEVQKEKRRALLSELQTDGGGKMCPTLKFTLHFGLAYHHSGLTTDERRLIEDAYSDGVLYLLTCTSTLAAGVNLPAKRVILRSPYVGVDFIKHSQYKQMTGRAGRAGIDSSGESILIAKKADMPKVTELLSGPQDMCHSSLMYQSGKGLRSLVLSLIGLKVVETTQQVYTVVQKSLLAIQASGMDIDIITAIRQALQQLIDSGLVVQKRAGHAPSQDQGTDLLQVADGTDTEKNRPVLKKSETKGMDCTAQDRDSQDLFEEEALSRSKRMRMDDGMRPSPTDESGSSQRSSTADDVGSNVSGSLSGYILDITELGRATFKGSVDIVYGSRLYEDLKQGEQSLVLANHLHLLYLVTPYDLAQDITPCWMTYLHQLGSLAQDELKVASLIGVTESFIVRKASGRSTRQKVDLLVVQRFYLTLMLYELWKQFTVWEVAERFQQTRGFVQNLLSSAASFASCVLRFCQELPELWAYQDLLGSFSQRLTYCVTMELLPLMEVPGIKLGRARQLYAAGYQNLQSLAAAEPAQLVSSVQFLTRKVARQIVSAAKVMLEEKTDALLEQVEQLVPLPQPSALSSSPQGTKDEH